MAKRELQRKQTALVFTTIIKKMIDPSFSIKNLNGGSAIKTLDTCLDWLENSGYGELSLERIVDYCVCQAYAISRYDDDYLDKWNIAHSFGQKATDRFSKTSKEIKYYEDKWLSSGSIHRLDLVKLISDKKDHPQHKFLYPEYEDVTKSRMLNTDAGYYICGRSTLLWTPFSPICGKCQKAESCKKRTESEYPELYRIRLEEYNETK